MVLKKPNFVITFRDEKPDKKRDQKRLARFILILNEINQNRLKAERAQQKEVLW